MAMKTSTNSNSKPPISQPPTPPHKPLPTLAATLLAGALGLAALYHATLGLEVVSTEDARRLSIERQPRALPPAAIHEVNTAAPADTLARAIAQDGRIAIVTFIYTSCNAVCTVLGSEFQQMQTAIRARGLQDRVRLISISFDPRDTPAQLDAYARRLQADAGVWQFVSVDSAAQRRALLAAFGIVVVPAPLGEFQHNAAFHLIDGDGRLARIDDYQSPDQALDDAVALAARRDARLHLPGDAATAVINRALVAEHQANVGDAGKARHR